LASPDLGIIRACACVCVHVHVHVCVIEGVRIAEWASEWIAFRRRLVWPTFPLPPRGVLGSSAVPLATRWFLSHLIPPGAVPPSSRHPVVLFPLVKKRVQNRAQNALTRPKLVAQRARRIWRGFGIAFFRPLYPPGGGSTVLLSHFPSRGLSWPDEAVFPYCGRKQSCTTFCFILDRPRAPNLALRASDSRETLRNERKQSCTTPASTTLTWGEAGGSDA
jgi:hypothetical protein